MEKRRLNYAEGKEMARKWQGNGKEKRRLNYAESKGKRD